MDDHAEQATERDSSTVATLAALPDVLTVDEVAAWLRLDRKTLYRAIARDEFPPARRIGGVIRISRSALLHFLSGEGRISSSRQRR